MKKNLTLILLLALALTQLSFAAESSNLDPGTNNPRPSHWPERLWRGIVKTADDVGYSLTQVIFDNIDEFDQNIFDQDKARMKAKVKRTVYDNHDVLNSYSVMDYFRVSVDSKDLSWQTPIFTPNLVLGFSIGVGGNMEWTNIRQVTANKYAKLPTIDDEYSNLKMLNFSNKEYRKMVKERKKEQKALKKLQKSNPELQENTDPGGDVSEMDTYGGGSFMDPSFRPRTSKLWNLVTFPFSLPVNLKRLAKMEDGELISYGVSGYVELGPKVGFTTNPLNLPGTMEASAFYRVFLKGQFKITILKENDRYVRVKITRKRERGSRWGVGSGARNYEVYDGFLLFEGKKLETRLLKTKLSLVPFQFQVEKKYIKSFDVGFRYDLKHEEAREAFKKSVFGSFRKSIELQDRVDPTTQDKIVERLFVKDAFGRQTSVRHTLDLEFLKKNVGKRTESVEAVLTLPNGEHKVFKESKKMEKEWKVAWGRFEKLNYNYTISLDKTAYLEGKKDSFQLIVEAFIEDSHTSGKEMKDYINQIQKALGKDDILPDMPAYLPRHTRLLYNDGNEDINDLPKMKKAQYRKSSFYYGFNINQEQLEKFIAVPEERMWPLLEKAFGVYEGQWATKLKRAKYRAKHLLPSLANIPLFLANVHLRKGNDVETAAGIKKNWMKIKKEYAKKRNEADLFEDIDYKVKVLSQIFSAKHYGHEMLRLLMFALNDEDMDYFLVATNDAFGRISQRGRVTTNPEYLLNLTDENIGFERLAGGFKSNPDILVRSLNSEILDDGSVKFEFELDHVPEILYFKMFKTNRLQKFTILAELAFKNKGRFKKGLNTIIVNKESYDELGHVLGKGLEEGNFYSLTMSSTQDGFSWSKVATKRFHYVLPIPDDQNEPDDDAGDDNLSRKERRKENRDYKEREVPVEQDEEVPVDGDDSDYME